MGFRIEPFEAWHMEVLGRIQSAEGGHSVSELDPGVLPLLERHNSWSLLTSEDLVFACGGTIQQWPGRHTGWLYFTPATGGYMVRLFRLVRHFLEPVRGRIEATVIADFEQGHRFVKMLGFEVENPPGILTGYGPDGRDHIAYVRFQ